MEYQVTKFPGFKASSAKVKLDKAMFDVPFNNDLVHQVITSYQHNGRQASRKTLSRAGDTHKPWRQKGTGRARAGSRRAPHWRGGGDAFAKEPGVHQKKVNQKMYRKAMLCILSEHARRGSLVVLKDLVIDKVSTKQFVASLGEMASKAPLVMVLDKIDMNLLLSSRNLHNVALMDPCLLNPYDGYRAQVLVITEDAITQLKEQYHA